VAAHCCAARAARLARIRYSGNAREISEKLAHAARVLVDYAWVTFSSDDLLAMVGSDDGMLRELRDIFEEEAPRVLNDILDAVIVRDALAIEHHTHLMKNVVATVGGQDAREIAMALERAARANDLGGTADLADRLAREISALRAALSSFISARSGV